MSEDRKSYRLGILKNEEWMSGGWVWMKVTTTSRRENGEMGRASFQGMQVMVGGSQSANLKTFHHRTLPLCSGLSSEEANSLSYFVL